MMPPMPPIAAIPSSPNYAALAGPSQSPDGQTAGAAQIGTGLVKMGMEIDQALKTLAKMAPDTTEWVLKVTQELQQQVGMALQKGQSGPGAQDASFPDGSSRVSGLG